MNTPSAEQINALLPQTQCTRCGYSGCKPYAEAIAAGEALINQCPPGGERTIAQLSVLLRVEALPLNPAHGVEQPRKVALIDESVCIGCTLCIQACPVDAIVGASKRMHTVIVSECTGCDLCVPVCPVDCISMAADPLARVSMSSQDSDLARQRFSARGARLARLASEQALKIAEKRAELAQKPALDLASILARAKAGTPKGTL